LAVDTLGKVCQNLAAMNERKSQFSLTGAASLKAGVPKGNVSSVQSSVTQVRSEVGAI